MGSAFPDSVLAAWSEITDRELRWPCERYIQYLIVGGEARWAFADIRRHIQHLGYPPPALDYLVNLRDRLERTRPKPYLIGGQPPEEWLRSVGIWDLVCENRSAQAAYRILGDHDLRMAVEAAILSGIPFNQVIPLVNQILGEDLRDEDFHTYRRFFWDRSLLMPIQWHDFLDLYPGGRSLALCYKLDPSYTLHHLGVEIETLDTRTMIFRVAQIAFFRCVETESMEAGLSTAKQTRSYAATITDAHRELSGATELGRIIDQVKQIGLKRKKKEDLKKLAERVPESSIIDGTTITKSSTPKEKAK